MIDKKNIIIDQRFYATTFSKHDLKPLKINQNMLPILINHFNIYG